MAFWNDPSNLTPKQSHRWVISLPEINQNPLAGDINKTVVRNNYIPYFLAKSVDRPTANMKPIQAKYLYSHTFNFPTRYVWNPIKITFYDVIINDKKIYYSESEKYNFFKKPVAGEQGKIQETDSVNAGNFNYHLLSTQYFFQNLLQKIGYYTPDEYDLEDSLLRFRSFNFKQSFGAYIAGYDPSKEIPGKYDYNYICIKELNGDGNTIEEWRLFNPIITDITPSKLDYSSDEVLTITVGVSYDWAQFYPATFVDAAKKKEEVDALTAGLKQPAPKIPAITDPIKHRDLNKPRSQEEEAFKPPKISADTNLGSIGTRATGASDRQLPTVGSNTPPVPNAEPLSEPIIGSVANESENDGDASPEEIASITGVQLPTGGGNSVIPRTVTYTSGTDDTAAIRREISMLESKIEEASKGNSKNKNDLIEGYQEKIQELRAKLN